MCINVTYSLVCTNCRNSFHKEGQWHFETPDEAFELAKSSGWTIQNLVPNGSLWDFCPRCAHLAS